MRSASKIFVIAVPAPIIASLVALGLAAAGCGGAQDTPPTPLTTHFDDMYIAAVPLDQKQSVVTSQNDWSIAKMENAKADADFSESATQLSIVRNEQKAAALGVESALASKKAADASADTNRINQATRELHTAESVKKAADERVKYFEAYQEFLRVQQRHALENMYWREAQYEAAKAQVGEKSGKAPKGVTYDSFPRQADERGKRASSSKPTVDAARGRAMSARDAWLRAQDAADRDNGRPANLTDPMASKSASNR